MKHSISTLAILLTCSSVAWADLPTSKSSDEWKFGIGVGVESQFSPYLGVDTQTNVIPAFTLDVGNFSLRGPNMSYRFFYNETISVSALARMREEKLDSSESDELDEIFDRDETIEMGIGLAYKTQIGDVNFSFFNDVEGNHDGYEASLGLEKSFKLSNSWGITPYTRINFRSDDLNDYYFGVSSAEANSSRLAYTAQSTTDFQFGAKALYKIDRNQMLLFESSFSTLGSGITDSPIVEDSSSSDLKAIYIYRF